MKERFLALIALLRESPKPPPGGDAAAAAAKAKALPEGMSAALRAMQTASYYAPRTYRPRPPQSRAASESGAIGAPFAPRDAVGMYVALLRYVRVSD
jgi:hypothetical protein